MLNNSPAHVVFGAATIAQAEKWRAAYHVALVNAATFLLLALTMFMLEPTSLAVILSAPLLFFLGSLISFLFMVRNGGALATIAWFVLGAGIFFGMGVVAGGVHVHPHSDYIFAGETLYLIRINLLNATSVFIVLAIAYPLANMRGLITTQHDLPLADIERILLKIFPFVVAISAVGVGLKYALFPFAENLLLRSVLAKIYLIVPACFLLLGVLWRSVGWNLKLLAGSVFVFEILNGLIGFTKYQVISAMLALVVGIWLTRRSIIFVLMTLMVLASVFAIINPLVTLGRAHVDYDAGTNSVETRLAILMDAGNAYYLGNASPGNASPEHPNSGPRKFTLDQRVMAPIGERLRALGRRFDVASIQGYLVNEYDDGRAGNSLDGFWMVMVPRVLWPDKPIITRFGRELNAQYYYHPGQIEPQTGTSIAPTYSAEAYWNHGPLGVVFVSLLVGLGIGWFTRCWQLAMIGRDPAFLLIAFPVAIWASFVESWVVATYLGEFIIFVVILFVARAFFNLLGRINHRGFP